MVNNISTDSQTTIYGLGVTMNDLIKESLYAPKTNNIVTRKGKNTKNEESTIKLNQIKIWWQTKWWGKFGKEQWKNIRKKKNVTIFNIKRRAHMGMLTIQQQYQDWIFTTHPQIMIIGRTILQKCMAWNYRPPTPLSPNKVTTTLSVCM